MRNQIAAMMLMVCSTSGNASPANVAVHLEQGFVSALAGDGTVWGAGALDGSSALMACSYNFGGIANISNGIWRVRGLRDVVAISGQVALRSDGTVWLWDNNGYDRLPFQKSQIYLPTAAVQIAGLDDVKEIAGYRALKHDGSVWQWERKFVADPADKCAGHYLPAAATRVEGLDQVVKLRDGWAIKADGTVWSLFQPPSHLPVLDGAVTIAGGNNGTTLFLKADGSLWGYGDNSAGLLGRKPEDLPRTGVAVRIDTIDNIKEIGVGIDHAIALKNDGSVWAWGVNTNGQICPPGDAPCTQNELFTTPVQLRGTANDVLHISISKSCSTLVKTDGEIVVIGDSYCAGSLPIEYDLSLAKGGRYQFGRFPFNPFALPADSETDRILDWAEQAYGSYFAPAGSATQSGAGYTFRYYKETKSYLGTKDGRVWYLPPGALLEKIVDVGAQAERLGEAQKQ